jgi:uncharacterized protein (UPF0147 family)
MPLDGDPRDVAQDPARTSGEICMAGKHLAQSLIEADHAALRSSLKSPAILTRLDSAEDYRKPRHVLKIASIMDRLGKNTSAPAAATISALTTSEPFLAHEHRIDLLIQASAVCRPPTPEVIAFWKSHSSAKGTHIELVAIALAKNATTESAALLEAMSKDPAYELWRRIDWFHIYVLQWRTHPENVALAERLSKDAALPRELRIAAVESIFDYRPEEWFPPHGGAEPEPWTASTKQGRDAARALAKTARESLDPLPPTLNATIIAVLTQLDAMDGGKQ